MWKHLNFDRLDELLTLSHTFIISFTSSSHITHWFATIAFCHTLFSVIRVNTPCSTVSSKVPGYAYCMSYLNCIKFQDKRKIKKNTYKLKKKSCIIYKRLWMYFHQESKGSNIFLSQKMHYILNSIKDLIETTRK